MYYQLAQQEFESYLNGYDRENDRIKLKIIHTYGVVKQAEELAGRMHLSAEDTDLARLIALLHDIGRFEQLKRYVFKNKCILSADRVTQMDYWVSYIVYFFDINFKESFDIIAENDYLNRIIDRIPYSNPVTKEQMENIRVYMQNFINSHTNGQSF